MKRKRRLTSPILFLFILPFSFLLLSCKKPAENGPFAPTVHPHTVITLTPSPLISQEDNEKLPLPGTAESFSAYADRLFRSLLAKDSLSFHYTLADPSARNMEVPEASLGTYTAELLRSATEENRKLLHALKLYSTEKLSQEEALLYRLLLSYLQTSVVPESELYYLSPLGPTTGLQTQLPVLLAEYRFQTMSDVEDYFSLLSSMPSLFESLASFEKERAAHGCGFSYEVLHRIELQCRSFIENPEQNFLIAGFQSRLSAFPSLPATERASLCMKNQKLVFQSVIPSYELLIETLRDLSEKKETSDSSILKEGLCSLPGGKECYARLVLKKTGSDLSIDAITAELSQTLLDSLFTLTAAAEDPLFSFPEETGPLQKSASELLLFLKEAMKNDFPVPASVTCLVREVHPSLSDYISPAFYLTPPMDDFENNVIYLNPQKCRESSIFSTLAHEGYPGHLFQNTFFASTNPHPLRNLLSFPGYDEGYATYAELFSYRYTGLTGKEQELAVAEQLAGLCIYSLADINLHYNGMTKQELLSFLTNYGFSAENAEEVYYLLLSEPASYLPYSVGCLQLLKLKEDYLAENKASSLLSFHTAVLSAGPMPFSELREEIKRLTIAEVD